MDLVQLRCVCTKMRALPLFGALSFGLLQLIGSGVADADCAMPRVAFAPAPGAEVPPNPELHVFVPTFWAEEERPQPRLSVLVDGKTRAHEVVRVTRSPAYVHTQLRVEAGDGEAITVTHRSGDERKVVAEYRVSAGWSRPASELAVNSAKYVKDEWSCSYTDAHIVELTAAPAYQVEWAGSEEKLTAGDVHRLVFPTTPGDFFRYGDREVPAKGQLTLGHGSCFGATAETGDADRYVRIRALYPDGSSAPVGGPMRLEKDGFTLLADAPAATDEAQEPGARHVCGFAYAHERHGRASRSVLLALLFAPLFFVGARRLRRRLSRERQLDLESISAASIPQYVAAVAGAAALLLALLHAQADWAIGGRWLAIESAPRAAVFVAVALISAVAGTCAGLVSYGQRSADNGQRPTVDG